MKTKICSKCHKRKKIVEFIKNKQYKDSYTSWCKKCYRKHSEKYRQIHKQEIVKYCKQYYRIYKDKILKRNKRYYQTHKKDHKKYYKRYMKKRGRDINVKLARSLRSRVSRALKSLKKSNSTMKLVGCSLNQLKAHLQKQFKRGMNWSNYGKWHIDHIKSCCSFNLSKPKEQKKCFHYTNLRPLWAKENLSRSKK